MPLLAVTPVVPCNVALPRLRVAVTTVLLSLVLKFPNASSIRTLGCCENPTPAVALAEVRRILRPDGQVRFYEHVRSAHRVVAMAEDLAAPAWARFAGGCHPNRDAVRALRSAGFDVSLVRRFGFSPQRGIPPTAHVLGRARRSR